MTVAQKIRADLKEAGFKARDISVRTRNGGYEEAVYVKIKSPYIKIAEVKDICLKYKNVRYDERCGEILAGGNTFVFVDYEYGLFDEVSKPFMGQAKELLAKLKESSFTIDIADGFYLFKSLNEIFVKSRKDGGYWGIRDAEDLAECLFKQKYLGDCIANK